jgi:ribosomal protein S18 acetylase RimI-like enzyme
MSFRDRVQSVTFRNEIPEDDQFLAELYASTREEELRPVPWTDEQKRMFLRSQYDAQCAHYRQHYYDADFLVMERDGERVGRLYLHWLNDDLRIVDIALMPSSRGHGIGREILEALMEDAAAKGCSVSIHVEINNPALRLYQRLGFRHVDEHGMYLLMQWDPPSRAK